MRVCFFGAYDPAYPRNRMLRVGLARAGCEVVEARVPERRAVLRYPELWLRQRAAVRTADVVVVPEFRHKDMPIARRLAGRTPLVFDPLVSRYDTLVGDWGLHARGSLQARWNRHIDRWTLGLGDRVLCDTWAHGRLFESLGVARDRLRRILVGAEPEFFAVPSVTDSGVAGAPASGRLRILYVGGFLPLHGVLTMIEAFARLERDGLDAELTLAGTGIDHAMARREVARRALRRVRFTGRVPYEATPGLLAAADLVLGAFGTSGKAGRVIPHKVYQGLAAGRAVVTGDGEGVREVFVEGRDLVLTARGDAAALAAALGALAADPARRRALGDAGRACAARVASVDAIGVALREVLEELA